MLGNRTGAQAVHKVTLSGVPLDGFFIGVPLS